MREYILLLPIIFIFHDMEEIVGFSTFFKNNPWIYERYPRITKPYRNLKTECFALAVYEEFIPFFGLSLFAYYFPGKIMYALWSGLLLALTLHFIVHIAQSIIIRKYIPSLITSIICLPVSIVILTKSATLTEFDLVTVLCLAGAVIFLIVNLKFAHRLMHWFAKKTVKTMVENNSVFLSDISYNTVYDIINSERQNGILRGNQNDGPGRDQGYSKA